MRVEGGSFDSDFQGPSQDTLDDLRARLSTEFALPSIPQPKPRFGAPSPINAAIFGGLLLAADDPDAWLCCETDAGQVYYHNTRTNAATFSAAGVPPSSVTLAL